MPNSNTPLTISVVICAYNEQDWIGKTLASLLKQKRRPDEVVVVNNASTDGTEAVVQQFIADHPELNMLLVTESKKGLHHARETGWRAAHSDIIVNTDADITFPVKWLQIIEKTFTKDPTIDAITGICRYNDALFIANWVTVMGDQLYQPQGIGLWLKWNKTGEYVLNGGNSAYRRRVLEAVNGYVGKPKDMLEDRYMSQKIQSGGYKIRFVRNLKVWHTFRRFKKDGWRGYYRYIFQYDSAENIYPDHLQDE